MMAATPAVGTIAADISDDIASLRRILGQTRTIAIVGLSADWFRPSHFAAKYMQEHGYRIIPVNPRYQEILGERCHPDLASIGEAVDMVGQPGQLLAGCGLGLIDARGDGGRVADKGEDLLADL